MHPTIHAAPGIGHLSRRIGAGEVSRRAVLAGIDAAARAALAEGAISSSRADQITRHVRQELGRCEQAAAA